MRSLFVAMLLCVSLPAYAESWPAAKKIESSSGKILTDSTIMDDTAQYQLSIGGDVSSSDKVQNAFISFRLDNAKTPFCHSSKVDVDKTRQFVLWTVYDSNNKVVEIMDEEWKVLPFSNTVVNAAVSDRYANMYASMLKGSRIEMSLVDDCQRVHKATFTLEGFDKALGQ